MTGVPPASTRLPIGTTLAVAGSVLAILSAAFAWGIQPAAPGFAPGIYPTGLSVPQLISTTSVGQIPTIAHVFVAIGLLTALLALALSDLWADIVRRLLAVPLIAILIVFGVRYAEVSGNFPESLSFPSSLRAGFYLAALGSMLILIGGSLRRRDPASR